MFHIVTLDDELFEPYPGPGPAGRYLRLVLNPARTDREILIAPHNHETFVSIQLLRLALHCRQSGIRVVSVGTMNQLPFFGMFSDEMILARGPLDGLFTEESSFAFDVEPWRRRPTFVDVYRDHHPGKADADRIPAEAVARAFEHPTVYLRRSTWEAFDSLGLEDGLICCEIKRHFYPRLTAILDTLGAGRVVGVDKSFQRELVRRVGDHWMGVQILASVLRGWRFIAAGGAVNLFNVIPVHPLLYLENQLDFTPEYQDIARRLAMLRYGTLPAFLSFPDRIHEPRPLEADDSVSETIVAGALAAAAVRARPPQVRIEALVAGAGPRRDRGRRFLYTRTGYGDREITLEAGGTIADGPGFNEHGWIEVGSRLVFTSADGIPRVQLQSAGDGEYAGAFVNSDVPRAVRLCPASSRWIPNSIVVRHHRALVRWVFGYEHDRLFMERNILPWALPDAEIVDPRRETDFTVGVYVNPEQLDRMAGARGQKFLLACEKEARYPKLDGAYSFVQDPRPDDDLSHTRYAPTLCCWCPPLSPPKSRLCSVVDSGIYPWRQDLIGQAAATIGAIDRYGGGDRPLAGYHGFHPDHTYGNDKVSGLLPYAFYLSLERTVAEDYLTEKLTDAILCECVPVYRGAPNAGRYVDPDAFIPLDDAASYDWSRWQALYEQKLPALRAAKEYLRTHLNVFSYFMKLVEEPSRLGDVRPI